MTETLEEYFHREKQGGPAFSGSQFESIGGGGDQLGSATRITAEDLVAVSLLGVTIAEHSALRLLGRDGDAISTLLEQIPVNLDLHAATDEEIGPRSHAARLWDVVRKRRDRSSVGPTRTSKLLARKRPRLLPVYDKVVRKELRLPHHRDYWLEMRDLLRDHPPYVDELRCAHHRAGLAESISTARTLDVLLWMSHPRRKPPPS
ncbi:DUF6308 family protein [Actinomycetospora flava]|uniref:DUF6308 family protein n=1 Tax=Actinomycetospora flava TaxID=3129232 RepID=A0ABU8M4Y9_9PSEU